MKKRNAYIPLTFGTTAIKPAFISGLRRKREIAEGTPLRRTSHYAPGYLERGQPEVRPYPRQDQLTGDEEDRIAYSIVCVEKVELIPLQIELGRQSQTRRGRTCNRRVTVGLTSSFIPEA
jgi:hypothetical protein